MPDDDGSRHAHLRDVYKRQALWKVGRRSFLVEHRLGPGEAWMVDTDRAMVDLDDGPGHSAPESDHPGVW